MPVVAIVLDLDDGVVHARNAQRLVARVPTAAVARHLAGLRRSIRRGDLELEGYARVVHIRDPEALDALVIVRRLAPSPGADRG